MRSKRIEQNQHRLVLCHIDALVVELVEQGHHLCDRGVHLEVLDVLGDLLNRAVHDDLVLLAVHIARLYLLIQRPDTVEEALAALDRLLRPCRRLL